MGIEHDLFVSYSRTDGPIVDKIRTGLEQRGLDVWTFERKIKPGAQIPTSIQRAIKASRAVAVAVSESSASSPWVAREFEMGIVQEMETAGAQPVVTLKLDDTLPPPLLRVRSWLDFSDPSRLDERINELARFVRALGPPLVRPGEQLGWQLHEVLGQATSRLTIWGHTLDKFTRDHRVLRALGDLFSRGVSVTLVLLNPHSPYAAAHAPFHTFESTDQAAAQFDRAQQRLCGLSAQYDHPRELNVLLTTYMPRFRTVLVDDSVCYASLYLYGQDVGAGPELVLRPGDPEPAGDWFGSIQKSVNQLLTSRHVTYLIRSGCLVEDWANTAAGHVLAGCIRRECCRTRDDCWADVGRTVLGYQDDGEAGARGLGLVRADYRPGTHTLADIGPGCPIPSLAQPFGDWMHAVLESELELLADTDPLLLQNRDPEVVKRDILAAFEFVPPFERSLRERTWVQEYSDVIRRVAYALLAGNADHELDLYPHLTTSRRELMLRVVRCLDLRQLGLHDWLRLSVAAGLLGVDQKPAAAATSPIEPAGAITLPPDGVADDASAATVANGLMDAMESEFSIDATEAFLATVASARAERRDLRVVSFPDDYLETAVLLAFYERLLAAHPHVSIDCVPRGRRCSNDVTLADLENLLEAFPKLVGTGRFRAHANGPIIGGVNILKLHPDVLRLMDRANVVDVRGARSYEMMQGINRETYFGLMVCREISELATGLPATDSSLAFIRQLPGDVSFSLPGGPGAPEPFRAIDNKRKWEGGHLATYRDWSTERRSRYHMVRSFYGPRAVQFRERFGDLLEQDVQADLRKLTGRVLVLGCGAGKEVAYLSEQGCDALGVDSAPEAIALAQEDHPELSERFRVADLYDLDIMLDGEFDGIVANAVLVHLLEREDIGQVLAHIHARLKPGGLAFIRVIDKSDPDTTKPILEETDTRLFGHPRWFVYYTADDLENCATNAGFDLARKIQSRPHYKGFAGVCWLSALLRKPRPKTRR